MTNNSIEFSLLLPTRGRVALVQRLLDSIVATSSDVGRVEVVLYIDKDDSASQTLSHPVLSLAKIIRPPGTTMGKMNCACYEASHGRYVMLINDDLIFRTPYWDARVIKAFSQFPDDIALVYGNDLDQGRAVPTFPIVSRSVCEVLGEISPRGYRNLHIESHLLDIFKQLARLGHNRICYLDDVFFEHMHYAVGKASADATYIKKTQRADDLLFIALDDERAFKAKLLAEYIGARTSDPRESPVGQGGSSARAPEQRKGGLKSFLRRVWSFSN